MIRIRGLILDGVALLGLAAGLVAGIGGYVHSLPGRLERVVVAVEKLEVEITGSIEPKGDRQPSTGG